MEATINPMDIGTGGKGGTYPSTFQRPFMCPYLFTFVALLENFQDAKMNKKILVPSDFRRSKLQNFPGEHALGPP